MPHIQPGSIVEQDDGERRVVVDISGDRAVLRYPEGDPRRQVDHFGGDMFLTAAPLESLTVVGRIDD